MGFNNPIIGGGGTLVYPSIHSPDYVMGVSGWTINKDGTVEFNNGIFRGQLTAGSITSGSIGDSTIIDSDINNSTIESTVFTMDANGGGVFIYSSTQTKQTLTGAGNFNVPATVGQLKAEVWGKGQDGKTSPGGPLISGGNGGRGGEYACEPNLVVTPGGTCAFVQNGANFNTFQGASVLVKAFNGNNAPASPNTIHFPGGQGGAGIGSATGGGGGGSGGQSSAGNNGATGFAGGTGGAAVLAGGKGGNGGPSGGVGSDGATPGGGGGGGGTGSHAGGNGVVGKVQVTYLTNQILIGYLSPVTGTNPDGSQFDAGIGGTLTAMDPAASPPKPEVWHPMTPLNNSWVNSGGAEITAQYRLVGSPARNIQVKGRITNSAVSGTSVFFSMPLAYRPVSNQIFGSCIVNAATNSYAANVSNAKLRIAGSALEFISLPAGTTDVSFDGLYDLDA